MSGDSHRYPHTAISTWSGFVYQGKLALYHCLSLMANDYEKVRDLKLQLESQDDFAIFRDDECLSLHQVKAYKSTNFSNYLDGICVQRDNAFERGVKEAYFHVAREISDLPETFEEDYHPVKLYCYSVQEGESEKESKSYCSLDKVDSYIENKIKELVENSDSLEKWKVHLCPKMREALEAKVSEKVIAIHHMIHNSREHQSFIAAREFIQFSTLYEVLEAEDLECFNSEEYFLTRIYIDIGIYYSEFCDRVEEISQEAQDKLDDYLAKITSLSAQDMKDFICAVMPHRKARFSTLNEYKDDALDRESMRQGLFKIFNKMVKTEVRSSEKIPFAWQHKGNFYYPTGIHTAPNSKDEICHDILERAKGEDVELLFEGGMLITAGIDVPSIADVCSGPDAIATEEEPSLRSSILGFHQVGLVSLNNVPEALKDEVTN